MQWAQKYKGFTIIELLVVIAIIGILAAIITVGYNVVIKDAKGVALRTSLNNAADAMKVATLGKSQKVTQLPAEFKAEVDTVLHLAETTGGVGSYCINVYRISSWEVMSYDAETNQVRPSLCTGKLIGDPVGGSLPDIPMKTNLVAMDFSEWTLSGGVTYDKQTKELTFSGTSGVAVSPLVRLAGSSASAAFSYELFSTLPSPNSTPQTATYSGSAYYGSDGVASVKNSSGYATNGNAQPVPLNAWTSRSWVTATGPAVHYVRFNINLAPTTWTSNNFKVRNPSIVKNS